MTNDVFSPQQYVTVPQVFEAVRITNDNIHHVAKWCHGKVKGHTIVFPKIRHRGTPLIPGSKDNNHHALVGNYVVRTKNGFVKKLADEWELETRQMSNRTQAS